MNPYDPLVSPIAPTSVTTSTTRSKSMAVLSETEAKKRLLEWNFDPDDVTKETTQWYDSPLRKEHGAILDYDQRVSKPIVIFSQLGDIPMLRYILKQCGRDAARKEELAETDEHGLFPLYVAVAKGRKESDILSTCKFLLQQGADMHQTLGDEYSCLFRACAFGYDKVALWLLEQGALLSRDGGEGKQCSFGKDLARRDLPPSSHSCDGWFRDRTIRKLFAWANETMTTQNHFFLFLSGTLVAPPSPKQSMVSESREQIRKVLADNDNLSDAAVSLLLDDVSNVTLEMVWKMTKITSSSSPLAVFNSHPGILEHIGKFVGVETRGRVLCTAQGLVEYEEQWKKE